MSNTLERLATLIASRRTGVADTSYTRKLLDGGPKTCAKKFGEEAVEVVLAAVAEDDKALKAEAADVLYHLLVLLEARRIPLVDVLAALDSRMGTSGLAEKAARKPS
jgi:phosphoribosyl-ATP pyrophosphohydrolase